MISPYTMDFLKKQNLVFGGKATNSSHLSAGPTSRPKSKSEQSLTVPSSDSPLLGYPQLPEPTLDSNRVSIIEYDASHSLFAVKAMALSIIACASGAGMPTLSMPFWS